MSVTIKKPSPFLKPREKRRQSAEAIKAFRAATNMSQREFAEHLTRYAIFKRYGILVTQWAIHSWETGKRIPDAQRQRVIDEVRAQWEAEHGVAEA